MTLEKQYDAIAIDYMIKIIENSTDHPFGKVCRFVPEDAVSTLVAMLKDYKQLKADYIDIDNRLRTANTEIDRLRSESSWIPCSERLPEDNVNVLGNITITVNTNIAKPKQRTIFAKHDRVFGWTTANGYPIVGKITHWKPIPEPPKEVHHDEN